MNRRYEDAALSGLPLQDDLIVDCHMHNARVAKFFSRFSYYEDLIAQMDAIGIDCGVVSNLWTTGECWQARREIEQMCAKYPGRFYAYAAPNPNDGFAAFCEELQAFAVLDITRGVKLHPVQHEKSFLCPEYRYAYDMAAERGWPVLLHTWGDGDMRAMGEVAEAFPNTILLLGHSGGEESTVEKAAVLARDATCVYLDTACSYVWQGALEAMVQMAGAQKVLFGSDAYWNSMEAAIGRVLFARISHAEKQQVLGQNAKQLFGL